MTDEDTRIYTREEVGEFFVRKAALYVSQRYAAYGVTVGDAAQEMHLWVLGHEGKVASWLAQEPQRTTRLYRTLMDVAVSYAEKEKATRCGYDVDDVAWFTPSMVTGLLPLALDDTFDGLMGETDNEGGGRTTVLSEGGDLMAKVMDIRRAVGRAPGWVGDALYMSEPGVPVYDDAVQAIVDHLGGSRHWVGRRRARSNASAQSTTNQQESA